MITNLLKSYSVFNPPLGYLQGMNDLFVPILLAYLPNWSEEGIPLDDNGNAISEEEYNQVCGNTTTPGDNNDVPSPETGSVVPYIAIGGGLLAIVAVYFFSKRSNKVYKI